MQIRRAGREGSRGWGTLSSKMGFLPASRSSAPDHAGRNLCFNLIKKNRDAGGVLWFAANPDSRIHARLSQLLRTGSRL